MPAPFNVVGRTKLAMIHYTVPVNLPLCFDVCQKEKQHKVTPEFVSSSHLAFWIPQHRPLPHYDISFVASLWNVLKDWWDIVVPAPYVGPSFCFLCIDSFHPTTFLLIHAVSHGPIKVLPFFRAAVESFTSFYSLHKPILMQMGKIFI